jgi:hypothetical protein
MQTFTAKPRQWGNSYGVTIPKKIIEAEHIKEDEPIEVFIRKKDLTLRDVFGTIPNDGMSMEEINAIIDEGYD